MLKERSETQRREERVTATTGEDKEATVHHCNFTSAAVRAVFCSFCYLFDREENERMHMGTMAGTHAGD